MKVRTITWIGFTLSLLALFIIPLSPVVACAIAVCGIAVSSYGLMTSKD